MTKKSVKREVTQKNKRNSLSKNLKFIKINEDKQFLISQRRKIRFGCMHGIDYQFAYQENTADEKLQKLSERMQLNLQEKVKLMDAVTCPSSSRSLADDNENEDEIIKPQKAKKEKIILSVPS